ncbi:hypothetical protein KAX03_01110 [Candidatus Bathyarchaeota archaeon]|nr:hypothetical protein [Candidatus Bathyarchaeota archaeon]
MRKWMTFGLICLLLFNVSSLGQIEKICVSSSDVSSQSLKIKVHFDGTLLADLAGELISPDSERPEANMIINFTKNQNLTIVREEFSVNLPTDFPYISMSGNGYYENRSISGELEINPEFGLPLENASLDFTLNETMIFANMSGTVLYETFLTYDIDNETLKEVIDELEASGLNQTYLNSTIYGPTNGKIECTELLISTVNGTSSANVTFSVKFEGDVFLGLVLMVGNLSGLPFPASGQETTISSTIDDTLDLIENSSFTITYSVEGELVIIGTTCFIETFNDDLQLLKNNILVNFFPGVEGFAFLHLTEFEMSNVTLAMSSDANGAAWSLKWLYMDPPIETINATDFDIPGLFDALGNIDGLVENLTFIIEGESNSTHVIVPVIPENVTQPDTNSSVTWYDVTLSDLEDIWFRVSSVTPPFLWIFSYDTMLLFTSLTGVVSFVVVLSAMYRRRFLPQSPGLHKNEISSKNRKRR